MPQCLQPFLVDAMPGSWGEQSDARDPDICSPCGLAGNLARPRNETHWMSFFWFLAAVMAAWTMSCLFTARIRLRGWLPIARDQDPAVYWLFIAGFVIG